MPYYHYKAKNKYVPVNNNWHSCHNIKIKKQQKRRITRMYSTCMLFLCFIYSLCYVVRYRLGWHGLWCAPTTGRRHGQNLLEHSEKDCSLSGDILRNRAGQLLFILLCLALIWFKMYRWVYILFFSSIFTVKSFQLLTCTTCVCDTCAHCLWVSFIYCWIKTFKISSNKPQMLLSVRKVVSLTSGTSNLK